MEEMRDRLHQQMHAHFSLLGKHKSREVFLTNVPECLCSPPRVPLRVFEPQLLRQVEERIAAHAGRTVG